MIAPKGASMKKHGPYTFKPPQDRVVEKAGMEPKMAVGNIDVEANRIYLGEKSPFIVTMKPSTPLERSPRFGAPKHFRTTVIAWVVDCIEANRICLGEKSPLTVMLHYYVYTCLHYY